MLYKCSNNDLNSVAIMPRKGVFVLKKRKKKGGGGYARGMQVRMSARTVHNLTAQIERSTQNHTERRKCLADKKNPKKEGYNRGNLTPNVGLAGNRTPDHSHAKGVLYH